MNYDVFNGDADGLCSLQQLRLEAPLEATLVTGVKRDNALLARVPARTGDRVTALDLALPGNATALAGLLSRGVHVHYVDHHEPGPLPEHPLLEITIDTDPSVCTSVIVDRLLDGRRRPWAIVGAFGDNLAATARRLAADVGIGNERLARWQSLGECLNYNAYGVTEEDLIYPPAQLHAVLRHYDDPDRFIDSEPHYSRLRAARSADLETALALMPTFEGPGATLRVLPDTAASRRAVGSLANTVAVHDARRAHAVAVPMPDGSLQLSLRVPPNAQTSADGFCRRFGGGGRRIAAGIDGLAPDRLGDVIEALAGCYAQPAASG